MGANQTINLERVAHLLPDSARLIARLIGLPLTLKLISEWGGRTWPVSKNRKREGQERFAALAEIIGESAANVLTRHYGGEVLAIPRCATAAREARDQLLRAQFDDLTVRQGLPALHATADLAMQFGMTERNVWYLLKKTDQTIDATQPQLF